MSYDNPQCFRQQMVRHEITATTTSRQSISDRYTDDEDYERMFADDLTAIRQEKRARKGPEPAHTQSSNTLSNPSGQDINVEVQRIHDEGDEALVVGVTQPSQSKIAEENTRNAPEATSETRLKRVPRIGKAKFKDAGQLKEVGGGSIEYFDESARSWRPAVRHDDIRGALIEQASRIGEYDHPRERGVADDDVTSYLPRQKAWGPDREQNWPDILHRLERRGHPVPDYEVKNLMHNGQIVLDRDDRPILDYADLPATLSTEFSGRNMEAITRLDPRIGHRDFWVRMPKTRRTGPNGQTIRQSYSLSTIGMRMTRFRQENGLLSWKVREGSKNIREFLIKQLPQENVRANSTQGIPPPSLPEQMDARQKNKGQHPARAGQRALSETARKERNDKEGAKLAKLRAAQNEAKVQAQVQGPDQAQEGNPIQERGQALNGNKRRRTRDASSDDEEMQRAIKRNKIDSAALISSPVSEMASRQPLRPVEPNEVPCFVSRKRSREESSSSSNDELPNPKRQMARSESVLRETEEHDEPEYLGSWKAENGDLYHFALDPVLSEAPLAPGAPTASQAVTFPQSWAVPQTPEASRAPIKAQTRVSLEAPRSQAEGEEAEGQSPLQWPFKLTAELEFPEPDDNMSLCELLERELEEAQRSPKTPQRRVEREEPHPMPWPQSLTAEELEFLKFNEERAIAELIQRDLDQWDDLMAKQMDLSYA